MDIMALKTSSVCCYRRVMSCCDCGEETQQKHFGDSCGDRDRMVRGLQQIAKQSWKHISLLHNKTMAASYHARSNSLPSRQHPIVSQIDENLNRLRASQSASTSSLIGHNLSGLQDLHECVDVLLQFPLTQQALAQEKQREMVEELLDGSLMLLDVCTTAKDALLQTKECTHELQSILRRRRGAEGLANEFRKYLTSRKAMKKAICKALENLKHIQNKLSTPGENGAVISVLRDVEAVTISVLESVLSFISGPEAESKSSRWSLVLKLMHQKKVMCEEEQKANKFLSAEAAVRSCIKSENMKHVENVQKELQSSELSIQDLEEGLETLSRHMIKTRVTVLNIISC